MHTSPFLTKCEAPDPTKWDSLALEPVEASVSSCRWVAVEWADPAKEPEVRRFLAGTYESFVLGVVHSSSPKLVAVVNKDRQTFHPPLACASDLLVLNIGTQSRGSKMANVERQTAVVQTLLHASPLCPTTFPAHAIEPDV